METVFLTLLNRSIAAGWLILAVIVLRLLLKKAPGSIRCALWGLVGLRLALPWSIPSGWSLVPSAKTVSPEILYASVPEVQSGISAVNQTVNPLLAQTMTPAVGDSVNPMQIAAFAAAWIWVAGMAVLTLYCLVSYLRLRRRVAQAVRLRDNLWQSEAVRAPFILGLLRPRIYLPFDLEEKTLAHAVAHEQAHLRRWDHWIKPLGFLLLTVYWFNPLVWAAYALLCRDMELACDEWVVRDMGTAQKKEYAAALLSCSVSRRAPAACPLAFGEVGVKGRIEHVLHYKKPARWILIAALAVCAVTAVCFLTDPKEEAPDPEGMEQASAAYPADMPEDFAVRFQWWIQESQPEIFDTYQGLLQKDLVQNGTAADDAYEATEETLHAVYEQLTALDAASIDRTMTTAVLTTDDTLVGVEPCTYYELQFTINGKTYLLQGDSTAWFYRDSDQDAHRFCELVSFLLQLVTELPEYQSLPETIGGYE